MKRSDKLVLSRVHPTSEYYDVIILDHGCRELAYKYETSLTMIAALNVLKTLSRNYQNRGDEAKVYFCITYNKISNVPLSEFDIWDDHTVMCMALLGRALEEPPQDV